MTALSETWRILRDLATLTGLVAFTLLVGVAVGAWAHYAHRGWRRLRRLAWPTCPMCRVRFPKMEHGRCWQCNDALIVRALEQEGSRVAGHEVRVFVPDPNRNVS